MEKQSCAVLSRPRSSGQSRYGWNDHDDDYGAGGDDENHDDADDGDDDDCGDDGDGGDDCGDDGIVFGLLKILKYLLALLGAVAFS